MQALGDSSGASRAQSSHVQLPHEHFSRALGEAVVRIWSYLPHDVQHHLFEEAVVAQGEDVRTPLAVFLHGKHARTFDPIRARDVPEPDSLGG
jgi:hypothetical protein